MVATSTYALKAHTSVNKDIYGKFLLVLLNLIGVVAFIAPFFSNIQQSSDTTNSRTNEGVILLMLLISICLVVTFAQLGTMLNTKTIALLGVLVAINSVLRLFDLLFPLPGGFSPMYLLIILVGYAYGAQLGFLIGALSLLASAFLTAGVGPWLPFQMFTAGWMGLLAGFLPQFQRGERWILASIGAFFAIFYGFIINLYFWPFVIGPAAQTWQMGLSAAEGFSRYLTFYLLTSAWWDIFGALGNFVMLFALGQPLLRAFRRFQSKFFPEIIEVE